jgi:hypothetical protein
MSSPDNNKGNNKMTTTNLSDFGYRELDMAADLLKAYANGKNNCPFFSDNGVQVMMNQNSGNVFLTDDDCNVLMMNRGELEGFYNSPYSGHEGFFDDLVNDYDDTWHEEDKTWLKDLAKSLNKEDELPDELKELEEQDEE